MQGFDDVKCQRKERLQVFVKLFLVLLTWEAQFSLTPTVVVFLFVFFFCLKCLCYDVTEKRNLASCFVR